MESNHFQSRFNADNYLSISYNGPGTSVLRDFVIRSLHEFFCEATRFDSRPSGAPLKVLDFGSGPVIVHVISPAGVDNGNVEIVLADYTGECREAVQKWLDRAPSAWDWTLYFRHVVFSLEGRKNEDELRLREDCVRKCIRGVVPCDITKDPPLAEEFAGPNYDVVMSILCLEGACETKEAYKAAVKRLASLVKLGGHLLLYCSLKTKDTYGHYHISGTKFVFLGVSLEFIVEVLRESGLTKIEYKLLPEEDLLEAKRHYDCNEDGFVFISATKSR